LVCGVGNPGSGRQPLHGFTFMTFVDCNVMLGQTLIPSPGGALDARSLLAEMDHLGIERTLFSHYAFGEGDMKEEMNRLTLADARQSERLIPTWVLSMAPSKIGEKLEGQVTRLLDAGVRAARFYPDEGGDAEALSLKIFLLEKLLDRMEQHRVPLLIPDEYLHGEATPHSPRPRADYEDIDAICGRFPNLPVVILQPPYNSQPEVIALAQRHKNFYFTIPIYGLFHELENTAAMVGAGRLLFGSNMPVFDGSLGIGMILYAAMDDRDKTLIAGENLKHLLDSVR